MLPHIRTVAVRSPFFNLARCYGGGHGHHMTLKEICEDRGALMDLLPQPEGDYKTKFAEKNRKFNMHILISALFFSASIYTSYKTGAHVGPRYQRPENYNIYEVMEQMAEEE